MLRMRALRGLWDLGHLACRKPQVSRARPKMMRRLLPLVIILALGLPVAAQVSTNEKPEFDIADFNKKLEVTQWLVAYDSVAWKTTDLALASDKAEVARLGKEWFCFQDKNGSWHAVYGRLEKNRFDQVFHYLVDAKGKITRTQDKIDGSFLISHARALDLAVAKLSESIPPNSPTHNSYIKQNSDKTFTVWLFPAFQTDGVAVYGGEFIYTIDPQGEKITKDESYFQGAFHGFKAKPPREIWLNYREKDKPTLGSIFFVWYYKEYFTNITIDNSKSTSTVIKTGDNYIWAHVIKDKKNAGSN
jgi:hypothetical protein